MIKEQSIFIVSLFILALPSIAFSQNAKKMPGYYIGINGDTVKGVFLNYNDWTNSPSNVKFNPKDTDTTLILTTADCRSFVITGRESYISYNGSRLTNSTDFNSSTDETDSSDIFDTVSVFLRVIFSNDHFKLEILSDSKRDNFFYQANGQPPVELIFKSFVNPDNSEFVQISTYKNQLYDYFSKSVTDVNLNNEVENLKYEEKSFLYFLHNIYNIKDEKIKPSYHNSYFVAGGIASNSFNTTGDNQIREVGINYNSNSSPVLLLGMIIPLQRNFGKLSFSPQLRLSSYKNAATYSGNSNSLYDTTIYTFKDNLTLDLIVNVGYNILQTKLLSWRIAAGGKLPILTNTKETINVIYYPILNEEIPFSTRTVSFNLQTSVMLAKRVILLAEYSFPALVTDYVAFSGTHSSFGIVAGWAF